MSRPKLEYIEWEDHACSDGWRDEDEVDCSGVKIHSAGWVVKETKRALVIAGTIDPRDKSSALRQYIIKSCITKRKRLKQ